jgi:hypothetical protein
MAAFALGVEEVGNGRLSAVGDVAAAGDAGASDEVGGALGLLGMTPKGLPASSDAPGAGEVVVAGWNATRGACRDDQTAYAATRLATMTAAAPAAMTTSCLRGTRMPVVTPNSDRRLLPPRVRISNARLAIGAGARL